MEINAPALWLNDFFAEFDEAITLAVHQLHTLAGGFFTPFFEGVSVLGKGGIFLILLSVLLMLYRPTRRFGTAMLLGLTIGYLITNLFLKVAIARPRPYTDTDSVFYDLWLTVNQHTESDKSFPSGHMTAACASMTALVILARPWQKLLAALFAILMGISRIYLVVHFPSDVLGGLIVGVFAGCVATLIAQKLPRGWYQWDFAKKKQNAGKHEVQQ